MNRAIRTTTAPNLYRRVRYLPGPRLLHRPDLTRRPFISRTNQITHTLSLSTRSYSPPSLLYIFYRFGKLLVQSVSHLYPPSFFLFRQHQPYPTISRHPRWTPCSLRSNESFRSTRGSYSCHGAAASIGCQNRERLDCRGYCTVSLLLTPLFLSNLWMIT